MHGSSTSPRSEEDVKREVHLSLLPDFQLNLKATSLLGSRAKLQGTPVSRLSLRETTLTWADRHPQTRTTRDRASETGNTRSSRLAAVRGGELTTSRSAGQGTRRRGARSGSEHRQRRWCAFYTANNSRNGTNISRRRPRCRFGIRRQCRR